MWDGDHSGTVEGHEMLKGLVLFGLGASIDFTKEVISKACKREYFKMQLAFKDFKALLLNDPKMLHIIRILEANVQELNKKNEKKVDINKAITQFASLFI